MAKPQHRTPQHKAARAHYAQLVATGHAYCVEPICLEERDGRTRWIPPGTPWDTCHDPTGTTITGPGHARCNRSEGATRGNRRRRRQRGTTPPRWTL